MPAIVATSVRKTYKGLFGRSRGREALAGLDLSIARGTAFGLIGLNGAGKTTFIKTMLGVVRPTQGSVRVLGGDPDDPRVRAQIGYLPERLFLPASATPIQFLESVSRLKGLVPDRTVLGQKLETVGLAGDMGRKIGGFSKGMRQRLGLAAALIGDPKLLILDEPTDGVDPLGRADIRSLLAEERKRGTTLFLNSHLLSETERVCDRIGILSDGKLVREGTLIELCGSETRYRARFAPGPGRDRLGELGFRARDEEGVFTCDAESVEELNRKIDQARQVGALLVELARDLRDLEEVLSEALAPRGAGPEVGG